MSDNCVSKFASLIYLFIYTIFQEGNIFSPKASLPYGPLNIDNKYNIKHGNKQTEIYTNLQTSQTFVKPMDNKCGNK